MRTGNKIILNAVDASVNQNSPAYWLDQVYGVALQAIFTGSPIGTIVLQGSCDSANNDPNNGAAVVNWTAITGSSTAISGAGTVLWNNNGVFYKWIRAVYTATSGTGTLTLNINTKGPA